MKRTSWCLALLVTLVSAGLLGCAENKAATGKCKSAKSSDDCSACCKENGANGHKYINGDCACLGGG